MTRHTVTLVPRDGIGSENFEDLYAGIEFEEGSEAARKLIAFCEEEDAGSIWPDSGISIKSGSVTGSDRIVRYALEYARKHAARLVYAEGASHGRHSQNNPLGSSGGKLYGIHRCPHRGYRNVGLKERQ